ncbi:MAG: serine/threonine-protein phosphatase, partial [Bacteroidetes bacterium]|nr:serine/threonine-protein phosphatase [Bacteroidota bacterium]
RKKEITKASRVLDILRDSIIEALQQKGQSDEHISSSFLKPHDDTSGMNSSAALNIKDGMDIVLCALHVFNDNHKTLQYAGANNPLFIVTKGKELKQIDPDKQPVAIYENMRPFTNYEIELNNEDTLYLCSDGYQDQFGGPNNKKFKVKQLKELFISIAGKPLNEQCEILNMSFKSWKGEHDQIDDVTVLGMKI